MKMNYRGVNVFYDDQGHGKAVVLLHGFLENSKMWKDLTTHISDTNRVITIDLLGHGQTGCLGYIHTMELMAESVESVLTHLKIDQCVLIGHSMGGYVALAFADLFPEKVVGLCLMNSTASPDSEARQINRDRAVAAVKQNHQIFVRFSITNLFAEDNREKLISEIEQIKIEALETPLQGIIAALEGMKIRKNREFILEQSQFNIMMIVGRLDPVLDYASLKEQIKEMDVELVEFSDGHMSHIENRYELTYKIKHFIEKLNSLT